MATIRVIGKNGNQYNRHNVAIVDKIGDDGRVYSIAISGKDVYMVIERDFYGPLYAKAGQK